MRHLSWIFGLTLSITVQAQDWQRYFPIQQGNSWEYKGGSDWKVQIDQTEGISRRISHFLGTEKVWLSWQDSTLLLRRNGETQPFATYLFGAPKGTTYLAYTYTDPWTTVASKVLVTVSDKDATATVPAKVFKNCIRFDFQFDPKPEVVGKHYIVTQWFAPGVGLVKESYLRNGLEGRSLLKSKIAGKVIGGSITGTLIPSTTTIKAKSWGLKPYAFAVTYTVRNGTAVPARWFFTKHRFKVTIREELHGQIIHTQYGSHTPQAGPCEENYTTMTLRPSQRKSFTLRLTPHLEPGNYTLTASITDIHFEDAVATAKLLIKGPS